MYFEAIFRFYVLLNHFVSSTLFRFVYFCSFGDISNRYFALTLAELYFYVDMTIYCSHRSLVGKQYYRLNAVVFPAFGDRAALVGGLDPNGVFRELPVPGFR